MEDPRDLALGAAIASLRVGIAAGRLALAPAILAARAPVVGPPVQRALDAIEAEGRRARQEEVDRLIDDVLAGPLTEAVARKLVEHRVVERAVAEIAATGDLATTVAAALDSPQAIELTEHILASPEMQRAVEHLAASPELRRALAEQSSGLAEDMVGGLRHRSESLDEAAERTVRAWLRRPRPLQS